MELLNLLETKFKKRWYNAILDNLDYSIKGIYRYLNKAGEIIYIGKGRIKERAKADDRSKWEIKTVEYSIIEENDKMLQWEEYHISRFLDHNGVKPLFNKIMGVNNNAA